MGIVQEISYCLSTETLFIQLMIIGSLAQKSSFHLVMKSEEGKLFSSH